MMQIVAVTDPLLVGFTRQAMIDIKTRGRGPVADALCDIQQVDYVVTTAVASTSGRGRLRGRRRTARSPDDADPPHPGRHPHRNLRVPETQQTALRLGNKMSEPATNVTAAAPATARRPEITSGVTSRGSRCTSRWTLGGAVFRSRSFTRGKGHHIWDSAGNRYFEACQACSPSSRPRTPPSSPKRQPSKRPRVAYFPLWSYAHPQAIELASGWRATPPAT